MQKPQDPSQRDGRAGATDRAQNPRLVGSVQQPLAVLPDIVFSGAGAVIAENEYVPLAREAFSGRLSGTPLPSFGSAISNSRRCFGTALRHCALSLAEPGARLGERAAAFDLRGIVIELDERVLHADAVGDDQVARAKSLLILRLRRPRKRSPRAV